MKTCYRAKRDQSLRILEDSKNIILESELDDESYAEINGSTKKDDLARIEDMMLAAKDSGYVVMTDLNAHNKKMLKERTLLKKMFEDMFPNGEFMYGYSKGDRRRKAKLLSIEYKNSAFYLTLKARNGKVMKYSFSGTFDDISHKTEITNKSIHVKGIDSLFRSFTTAIGDHLWLGSEANNGSRLHKSLEENNYLHGNAESMLNMLEKVHRLGGKKATDEDMNYYRGVLEKFSNKPFEKLSMFISTEANRTKGVVTGDRIEIRINPNKRQANNEQTEASVYMEEVVHSYTRAGIEGTSIKARQLQRKLTHLSRSIREKVKWEDFLVDRDNYTEAEEKKARKTHDYIFNSENSDHELIAKAIAMPQFGRLLAGMSVKEESKATTLFGKLMDFMGNVFDVLLGNVDFKTRKEDAYSQLVNLAGNLADINNEMADRINDNNIMQAAFDTVTKLEGNIVQYMDKLKELLTDKQKAELGDYPRGEGSTYKKANWLMNYLFKTMVNAEYRKAAGLVWSSLGVAKPEGFIREFISGLFEQDSLQKAGTYLGFQSGYIDSQRNQQIGIIKGQIRKVWSKGFRFTEPTQIAFTKVMVDTDLTNLYEKKSITGKQLYDNARIRELLTNEEARQKQENKVRLVLKEADLYNYKWNASQAAGLGYMMVTGKGGLNQNVNAEEIARGTFGVERPFNGTVARAVDELATLVALKYTSTKEKEVMAELMKEEYYGVRRLVELQEGFKKESEEVLFKGAKRFMRKGYSKSIYDSSITVEVAPLEDQAKMEAMGYTLKGPVREKHGVRAKKEMGFYVTDSFGRGERLRAGVRLNGENSMGTTLSSIIFREEDDPKVAKARLAKEIAVLQVQAQKISKQMAAGTYDPTLEDSGLTPIVDTHGRVVDYRYMMSSKLKEELLGEDKRITEVMSRSYGAILDKSRTKDHNKHAIQLLLDDMRDNWYKGELGRDGLTEYRLIGPDVKDPKLVRLYHMLPHELQKHIRNRQDKTLAVRADMMNIFFGYDQASIANLGLVKISPKVVKRTIQIAETMWVEMIKVVKTNILLKTPEILLENFVSNLIYATMRGYNPVDVIKLYVESWRDIKDHNATERKIKELLVENRRIQAEMRKSIVHENRREELKRKEEKIKLEVARLKKELQKNEVHELIELGMDQNVEDLSGEGVDSTNKWSQLIEKNTEKAPQWVKTTGNYLFLTKDTVVYKVAQEAMEMSDLMARDVQNRMEKRITEQQIAGRKPLPAWYLKDKPEGYKLRKEDVEDFRQKSKEVRLFELVEDYIAYSIPSSRYEEYFNRIGLLMFTKYTKRIQRIIMKSAGTAPIKSIVAASVASFMGGAPTIHDSSFLVKDWYTDTLGPGNIFPIYSPTENLMNFITPSVFRLSNDYSLAP